MSRFYVGDRVKIKSNGLTGSIVAIDYPYQNYTIRWDGGSGVKVWSFAGAAKYLEKDTTAISTSGILTPRKGYYNQSALDSLKALKEFYGTTPVKRECPLIQRVNGIMIAPITDLLIVNKKCECGSSIAGSDRHSTWCPLHE